MALFGDPIKAAKRIKAATPKRAGPPVYSQLVGLGQAPAAVLVLVAVHLLLVDQLEDGREDPPGLGQLVRAHKVDLAAQEHVQDETLVRLRHVEVLGREKRG